MNAEPRVVTSRDNPLVQRLRKLAGDGSAYRRAGELWLEGEHLCAALRARGQPAKHAVVMQSAWPLLQDLAAGAARTTVLADALFKSVSSLESPARIGFLIDTPAAPAIRGC